MSPLLSFSIRNREKIEFPMHWATKMEFNKFQIWIPDAKKPIGLAILKNRSFFRTKLNYKFTVWKCPLGHLNEKLGSL